MRKNYANRLPYLSYLAVVLSVFSIQRLHAQTLAFPGAEGFGKYAKGGRYGSVYHVTNLNNSGTGSLRDAVSAPNRIVVFDVAGVIRITSRMVVSANIYLAGQTAPGEGITVYGNGWSFSGADNTICRYLKIRMGIVGDDGKDANGLADGHDIIFDHCSVSWGRDENFSINSTTAKNITIQNCIISQGLMTHSAGGLIQADSITLYRNLYADNTTRNNKIKGINQYVNNIVYNWKDGAYIMGGESEGNSYANATNNCFIGGPSRGVPPFNLGNLNYHLYQTDNLFDSSRNGLFDPYTIPPVQFVGPPDFQLAPYPYPAVPTLPANSLVNAILPAVGASLPYRDYADYYVVNEVRSFGKKGELIANENSLPFGAPTSWNLWPGTPRIDSDNDGMPDAWETANGTNPAANDAMVITAAGYTNIENYINSITASNSQDYLRAPMKLKQDSATQNTVYLSWLDYTEKEQGYIVERMVNGVWTQIGTTGIDINYYAVTGLQPEEVDTFRVKAFNALGESGYANELIAKSKPVEVPVLNPGTFTPSLTWTGALSNDWDKTTKNWIDSTNTSAVFTDSSSLTFPEAGQAGKTINVIAPMAAGDILVNSNGNYTFSGPGIISGTRSMNKAGSGTLSLLTNNTYTGATVLHGGAIQLSTLANGGVASAMGASANYAFNWVWKGGSWLYTGGNVGTDRNATLDATTEFNVSNPASTVTFNGVLSGDGGLIKSGPGRMVVKNANPYAGETIINGGILEVSPVSAATLAGDIIDNNQGIGTSNVLRLHNGSYVTSNGSGTIYENYPLQLYIDDSTVNGFTCDRNANLNMTVHGGGTLNYTIPYLREIIQGDWSDFTGTLVANGINTDDVYSLLPIDNGTGFPNNRLVVTGNTKIAAYSNNEVLSIGGLSGNAGTWLSCGGTKSPTFGNGFTTYVVGGMGTNETFNGIINNHLYGNAADGSGTTTIVKTGTGLWRLNGNNTYIGTTTIEGGKLIVNGANSGNGKVTVNDGATLAGKGSVTGVVEVAGTLEPGDSSIATFTGKDNLSLQSTAVVAIEINKSNSTWDKVAVTKDIKYDGTLRINFTGTPVSGDKYKLFNVAGAITGTITQFDPATPGPGLLWVFKPATGELAIQSPNFVEGPTNLTLNAPVAKAGMPSSVNAGWTDNSDNEDYFIVERSTDSVNFTDVAHVSANTTDYSDGGLQSGMKYYYRVKAHSPLNESAYSAIVGVTTPVEGTLPLITVNPSPLQNASNVFLNNQAVSFNWEGNYADSFDVYIGTRVDSLVKVGEVAAETATFNAANLDPNTKYYWRIDARNSNGTTTGTVWNFQTANIPVTVAGDYRSTATGNWGTSSVATDIWETYDGSSWQSTATPPSGSTPTVTIRTGHTVALNATTGVNNVVVETGANLVSGTSDGASGTATQRNLRVAGSINNFGTVGSSTVSTNRVNFEGYRDNGKIFITGTGTCYLNTFTVNGIAQTVEVVIDNNCNLASYMRANYSTATTLPWTTAPQNDDNITITIKEGKTVTMGSSGYLQAGSSPTTNTIAEFGNYTFNINGTLDMRSTGTSCVVGHATLPRAVTINVNGTWLMGNAIRFITTATTPAVGTVALNIGDKGVADAGARTIGSSNTATNIVATNSNFSPGVFFNITGGGLLKTKVATSAITYQIGADNVYTPVKLTNTGTADIIGVGVKTGVNFPVADSTKLVNRLYTVVPATPATTNLAIGLGWLIASQAANLNPAGSMVQGRYTNNTWTEFPATVSGAGTAASPYYATAAGYTSFGNFAVGQTGAVKDVEAPIVRVNPIEVILGLDGTAAITAAQVNDSSYDHSSTITLSVLPNRFTTADVGIDTVTLTATDASGNSAQAKTTVTVKKRVAIVTYTGDSTEQYSDKQILTAVLADSATGTLLKGKAVVFSLASQTANALTDTTGKASTSLLIAQDPALAYTLTTTFAGDSLFIPAVDSVPFVIKQEDARAYYTGTLFGATGSGTTTTITLSATLRDITAETTTASTDAFAGDISKAKVTFIDRTTNTVIATVPVGLVSNGDLKVGTATYNWPVDIGTSDAKDFTIGIQVTGYYQREVSEDNTIVTVSKSLKEFVSGGGTIQLARSAGQMAGDVGSKANFGFNVKYNKSNKNLQGNFNTIIRRTQADGVHVYQVKGNVLNTLWTIPGIGLIPAWASFSGKASIQDITNPLAPVSVDGNATVKVEMTDRNDAGTGDAIAITIWNKSGGLWFASNWNGILNEQQVLAGGNIRISTGLEAFITGITDIISEYIDPATGQAPGKQLEVTVAPNPAVNYTNLTINANADKGNVRIVISDLFGKVIEAKEIAAGRTVIQLGSAYRPGVYTIEVSQGQKKETVKLIKLTQ
ncbi:MULTISPECIES: autotransporter-associated beta strand repeat-containing protein [Niastella]|uniref:Autotransporter-associated beta strand repeat-containing protein n=1 Tax=Niastella soli TaxID=2821487 RepID=A0ABS3YX27_9BACT|nr:autotransporter-associated beta strand repeat-containing protein [Niastella soli]MBO9202485.1 autotransporter-associated beta strand repeat-containing protein [Niastella soli]